MRNAHERFGTLEFVKRVKDTTTRVRVYMDRLIVEMGTEEHRSAGVHLLSVMGSDAEIAALWAGVMEGALLQIQIPGRSVFTGSLGPEAQCFRGSVMVAGRNRPARHLVAVSAELAKTKPGADRGRWSVLHSRDIGGLLESMRCLWPPPVPLLLMRRAWCCLR